MRMRISATSDVHKTLTSEQSKSYKDILGLINDELAAGRLVVDKEDARNPAGRWVGDRVDTGHEEEQTEYIDQEG